MGQLAASGTLTALSGQVRETHPDLTIILYISGSGGLLERMAAAQPDVVSVDQRVDLRDAIKRIGPNFAVQVLCSVLRLLCSCNLHAECTAGLLPACRAAHGYASASSRQAREVPCMQRPCLQL